MFKGTLVRSDQDSAAGIDLPTSTVLLLRVSAPPREQRLSSLRVFAFLREQNLP
jgi:hypothetical protein